MNAHPLADRYPLLTGDEYETFKADIAANGLKNPIWLFRGLILDGRNRQRACEETGTEPVYQEFDGTDAEATEFVKSQNEHRRHLDAEWRKARVAELRAQGKSTRDIAEAVGASKSQIADDLNEASGVQYWTPEAESEQPALPVVTGKDGKTYRQAPKADPEKVVRRHLSKYPDSFDADVSRKFDCKKSLVEKIRRDLEEQDIIPRRGEKPVVSPEPEPAPEPTVNMGSPAKCRDALLAAVKHLKKVQQNLSVVMACPIRELRDTYLNVLGGYHASHKPYDTGEQITTLLYGGVVSFGIPKHSTAFIDEFIASHAAAAVLFDRMDAQPLREPDAGDAPDWSKLEPDREAF